MPRCTVHGGRRDNHFNDASRRKLGTLACAKTGILRFNDIEKSQKVLVNPVKGD